MTSLAPNAPAARAHGEATDLPPALAAYIDAALAAPSAAPARTALPRVGGRTLHPIAPITILPMSAARGAHRPAIRFPTLADLAVVLVLLAVVTGVLGSLGAQDRLPAGEGVRAVSGVVLAPSPLTAPRATSAAHMGPGHQG